METNLILKNRAVTERKLVKIGDMKMFTFVVPFTPSLIGGFEEHV